MRAIMILLKTRVNVYALPCQYRRCCLRAAKVDIEPVGDIETTIYCCRSAHMFDMIARYAARITSSHACYAIMLLRRYAIVDITMMSTLFRLRHAAAAFVACLYDARHTFTPCVDAFADDAAAAAPCAPFTAACDSARAAVDAASIA